LEAQKKKLAHDIKVRMSKFKRAKKKLITKVRAGAVFGGGGLAAFGLGRQSDTGRNNFETDDGKKAEAGTSSSMLLGALMAPESVDADRKQDPLDNLNGHSAGRQHDGDLNFAWPGRDAPNNSDDESNDSSDSELSPDEQSGDQSGSHTDSGLDASGDEDEEQTTDKKETDLQGGTQAHSDNEKSENQLSSDGTSNDMENLGNDIVRNETGKIDKENVSQGEENEEEKSSLGKKYDDAEEAYDSAPTSIKDIAQENTDSSAGLVPDSKPHAENIAELSSGSSLSSESTSSDSDEGF